ncbi:MAG: DUF4861 domain-containing protein [Nitrospirae bacterium]|nr:DUF4861 domain-containing protein [Nitrospirota bacterium]
MVAQNRKEKIFQMHAEVCKSFSGPTRLKVLDFLRGGEMNKGGRFLPVLLLLLLFPFTFSASSANKWWNENWTYRVELTFRAKEGLSGKDIPVVITAEKLYKKIGIKDLNLYSLRVINAEGAEVPLQIDEKDGTGEYQKDPNGKWDRDDEVVFSADIDKDKETVYWLYFRKAFSPLPEYPGGITAERIVPDRDRPYDLELTNGDLTIGIRGKSTVKDPLKGVGQGRITMINRKEKKFFRPQGAYANNFMSSGYGSLPWKLPEMIKDGPVRAIVRVETDETEAHLSLSGRSAKFAGKVSREIILYRRQPFVEVKETIRVKKAREETYRMIFLFPLLPSGTAREWDKEEMLVPVGKKVVRVRMEDKRMYNKTNPERGWIAFANPEEKTGMAVFFQEKNASVSAGLYQSSDERYRKKIEEEKVAWFRKWLPAYLAVDYREKIFDGSILRHRFGAFILSGEKPEVIPVIYDLLWGNGVTKCLSFGFPQEHKE